MRICTHIYAYLTCFLVLANNMVIGSHLRHIILTLFTCVLQFAVQASWAPRLQSADSVWTGGISMSMCSCTFAFVFIYACVCMPRFTFPKIKNLVWLRSRSRSRSRSERPYMTPGLASTNLNTFSSITSSSLQYDRLRFAGGREAPAWKIRPDTAGEMSHGIRAGKANLDTGWPWLWLATLHPSDFGATNGASLFSVLFPKILVSKCVTRQLFRGALIMTSRINWSLVKDSLYLWWHNAHVCYGVIE